MKCTHKKTHLIARRLIKLERPGTLANCYKPILWAMLCKINWILFSWHVGLVEKQQLKWEQSLFIHTVTENYCISWETFVASTSRFNIYIPAEGFSHRGPLTNIVLALNKLWYSSYYIGCEINYSWPNFNGCFAKPPHTLEYEQGITAYWSYVNVIIHTLSSELV